MIDRCEVDLDDGGAADLKRLMKKNRELAGALDVAMGQVENVGWMAATRTKLVVPLVSLAPNVGEIRLMGRPSYRAIFFWCDDKENRVRRIFITSVVKKPMLKKKRLRNHAKQAAARRSEHESDGDC